MEAVLDMPAGTEADVLAITGDIAEADDLASHLHAIAARMGREPVGRGSAADLPAAVRELDVVIAWCEGLVGPVGGHHRG